MSGKRNIITDDEMLKTMYNNEKQSLVDISKVTGLKISTVRLRLIQYGVILRTRAEAIRLHPEKLGAGNRGKKIIITEEHRKNIRIGALKRWEGKSKGISLKPSGYYEITTGKNKGRMLHHVIMELHIGRRLRDGEVVHHKNGIRTDNEITNLELMTKSEHSRLHAFMNISNGTNYDITKQAKSGERHNKAKLTEASVMLILGDNRKYKEIALQYNVSISCIKHIKKHRNWKYLTEAK